MIEEEARVVAVEPGRVWLEKPRRSACAGCAQVCVGALTSGLLATRSSSIPVRTSLSLGVGDWVIIGLDESALLRSAFQVYLVPLFALFAGALLGDSMFAADWGAALAGSSGAALSLAGMKFLGVFDRVRLQPVILREVR
jgi:sigma-E factor negative regulatory protein RseC